MNFKKLRTKLLLAVFSMFFAFSASAQEFNYTDNIHEQGINLAEANAQYVSVTYSIKKFSLNDININRENMKTISLSGHFLPNDEGMPDLPGQGRYIAIPQGATPVLNIKYSKVELIENIDIAPAPVIPLDTDDNPLVYEKNQDVYSKNAFYPENAIELSEKKNLRGVDVVMLGITPFQYNPVTKELKVCRDMEIEITFKGGNGQFGEERLRSRHFDPIIQDAVLNSGSLPVIDYSAKSTKPSREEGAEYLIITPNDDVFQQWADTIKKWRIKQGITTKITTLNEIGGNSSTEIENYIDTAYYTWDTPPAAILILGDYGYSANNRVTSPFWSNYCVSDNIYGDVDDDDLPDIVMARITAQNASELETMITKFINYEKNPPTAADFYDHPITALGWQTERWFQICSETVGGYFKNEHGKNPVRINEIYDGNPDVDPWSTASNTSTILDYFGPNGTGYIPASPSELGNWSGGNAFDVNNAINDGAFLLQHRDHGYEYGWGEPAYSNSNINGLTNTDLTFVMSVNCLTGKYNISGECFVEKFHRYTHNGANSGALGLIGASEVSYSFVNDTYVWGVYNNMWTDFLPDYGTNPDSRGLKPAFGNAAGKYYLEQSNWPYNNSVKVVTYHLFHHHGGAFLTLYSEVPQDLTVVHNDVLLGGVTTFTVTADEGSFIALTNGYEILGTADGTGDPVAIEIPAQTPGDTIVVTVTKRNHFRYEQDVPVISPEGPYCVYESSTFSDENTNGQIDYAEEVYLSITVENLGLEDAGNVDVTIRTNDVYVSVSDSTETYGTIPSQETVTVDSGFLIQVAPDVPDDYTVVFDVESTDGNETWNSSFTLSIHAPVLDKPHYVVIDDQGNGNGEIDPGETVDIKISVTNSGTSDIYNAIGNLGSSDEYITILTNNLSFGNIPADSSTDQSYTVEADASTPIGHIAEFQFELTADYDYAVYDTTEFYIGKIPVLVIDLDPGQHYGQTMIEAIEANEVEYLYDTEFPQTDYQMYGSIFVILGNYESNHGLTQEESDILVNYLESGGNVYMEGRRTWYTDEQKPVHSMFNVDITSFTSWFEYVNIYGEPETFTEDMLFTYEDNGFFNYNLYYLDGEDGSFVVLRSEEEDYGCAVANETDTYKTIASSFEFSALVDAGHPSTKKELMAQYLMFFGVYDPYVNVPENDYNGMNITAYPNPFNNQISFSFTLEANSEIRLDIIDMQGRIVSTVEDKNLNAGSHTLKWNGTSNTGNLVEPGIYFYKFSTGDQITSGKITLIK